MTTRNPQTRRFDPTRALEARAATIERKAARRAKSAWLAI